jgi:hypothetical protein
MPKYMDRVHLLQANAISVTVNTIIRNRATNAIPQALGTGNVKGTGGAVISDQGRLHRPLLRVNNSGVVAIFLVYFSPDVPIAVLEKRKNIEGQ